MVYSMAIRALLNQYVYEGFKKLCTICYSQSLNSCTSSTTSSSASTNCGSYASQRLGVWDYYGTLLDPDALDDFPPADDINIVLARLGWHIEGPSRHQ